jgi:hypothetical protein
MGLGKKLSWFIFLRSFLVGVGGGLGASSFLVGIFFSVFWFYGELIKFVWFEDETN